MQRALIINKGGAAKDRLDPSLVLKYFTGDEVLLLVLK